MHSGYITSSVVAVALATTVSAAASNAAAFVVPPTRYSSSHSFRGLSKDSTVDNYGVSGHADTLPGVHDFLRLVPPTPLAHGAVFSEAPLTAEEWIVEMAFRVHGPPASGITEKLEDGTLKKVHKGGRGLAFWYTKQANPGPITISSNPKISVSAPPPTSPQLPQDSTDTSVSLFGGPTQFDGLGVIFDAAPTQPLLPRSDRRNWASTDMHHGLGATGGVVSGIMDDGTGHWLDTVPLKDTDEASYLGKAVGECEAMFRNANGLLWSRISYVNHTLRVDLDLSPHTSLSQAGRDYAHNCFSLPGINLSPGHYVGVSGMASGYVEPDTIDIYAMDVFEVLKDVRSTVPWTPLESNSYVILINAQGQTATVADNAPVDQKSSPLDGTTDEPATTLTQEIFVSQARMMEAIDGLSRQLEYLGNLVRPLTRSSVPAGPNQGRTMSDPHLDSRLARIEARFEQLASRHESGTDNDIMFDKLAQLQDRLINELQSVARKLDAAQGQSSSSLSKLSSSSAESLQILQDARSTLERVANTRTSVWAWLGGVALFVAFLATSLTQRRGGSWQARKMI